MITAGLTATEVEARLQRATAAIGAGTLRYSLTQVHTGVRLEEILSAAGIPGAEMPGAEIPRGETTRGEIPGGEITSGETTRGDQHLRQKTGYAG
jgi:hypothetical protein